MKNIAIIDADLIGRKNHNFPNLVCMKLSAYYGANLKTDYENLDEYDKVYIAKVFTDTPIDDSILSLPNVEFNGTGFYYDKATPLPDEIEHIKPNYDLYTDYIQSINLKPTKAIYYTDYSIGFTTRGCFRKCPFCVNQNYDRVVKHSPVEEFLDTDRKRIALLDDNFFGYPYWKDIMHELKATNKPFQFRQGLDERLLDDEKCEELFNSKYDGVLTFAFDNIADRDLVESKIKLIKKYSHKKIRFFVLCGFDRDNKYDNAFWDKDIHDLLERIHILRGYGFLPYVMRFNRYVESPYKGMYIELTRWCNNITLFTACTFRQMAEYRDITVKRLDEFEKHFPNLKYYFDTSYVRP